MLTWSHTTWHILVTRELTARHFINTEIKGSVTQKAAWRSWVEFNTPLDTVYVISEAVFTANHLTDTDKQNSTGEYTN